MSMHIEYGYAAPDAPKPILPDLIPLTSWGSSLANLLTKPAWDSIRLPVIRRYGHACQICRSRTGKMECHEIWAYSMPPQGSPSDSLGVQRLIGLAALCAVCHLMFHMGFARVSRREGIARHRLMSVNGWSVQKTDTFLLFQSKLFELRSSVGWVLNMALVAGESLIINGKWTRDQDGYLTGPIGSRSGITPVTAILGAPYRIGEHVIPAVSLTEALEGLGKESGDFAFVERFGNGITDENVP